jgi:energy-coupling factor transport system ATP-binding protein
MNPKPVIQFSNFSFRYAAQKYPTLKNINLTIFEGEKVLIIGPSGSGKSTLGYCINGLIPHSYPGTIEGELIVQGQDPSQTPIHQLSKSIGTVLQDTDGQFVGLSVAEDIAFALENDCVPVEELKRRAGEAAKIVGLENVIGNSPQEVSGGQKQRTALAGILVDEVEMLLFDEPLAYLDPATGKKAMELIDEVQGESEKTVIIIEHRIEDVLHRKIDRIILIHEGEIMADMGTHEIICTDLFAKYGIREPLYVTLLKYAGVEVTPEMQPGYIHTIDLQTHKDKILDWFRSTTPSLQHLNEQEAIQVSDLSFAYTTKTVLDQIDFAIKKGEMLAIVGRNGAGKSTLAMLICGFETGHQGVIALSGENALDQSIAERAAMVGYVMQNPNHMFTEHIVFEEVALGLRLRDVPEDEIQRRVEKTMKICGIERFAKWPINALSYGQKKRVTIAAILVLEPEVIILDEPTAGQDYRHYTEIMEFLKGLNRDLGITIILITHDMHLMMEYTKRSIVLSEGELIADTDSSAVLTNVEIVEKGSLKETSLYHIAQIIGIDNPKDLVDAFVSHEKSERGLS